MQELRTGREERGEDPWIERLRERLSDEDMGVVGAAVNVICEAARRDPRKYLPLAPELFGLLTASTNNWMLIKIVKLVRSRRSFRRGVVLTYSSAVRRPHARRASPGEKAPPAAHRAHRDDARHVAPVRVHPDVYCRGHAQRSRG